LRPIREISATRKVKKNNNKKRNNTVEKEKKNKVIFTRFLFLLLFVGSLGIIMKRDASFFLSLAGEEKK
jgi:hypothetical protein